MSLNIAKAIHLLGVAMLLMSLGGLALHSMNGGTKENNPSRKLAAVCRTRDVAGWSSGLASVPPLSLRNWP